MRVIGIDPGLSITGIGILDENENKIGLCHYGTIKAPAREPLEARLDYIFNNAMELIRKYQPDELAVEDSFYGKNAKTAILLGQARGVLMLAGAQSKIPCFEYAPRKVKQSVVGNGAATKEQVQYMVKSILKMPTLPKPLDASDALAIGICHLHQKRWS